MQSDSPKSKSSRKRSSKKKKPKAGINDLRFGSPSFFNAAEETWKEHGHLQPSIFLLPEEGPPSLQTVFCVYPAAKERVLNHSFHPIIPPPDGWPFEIMPNRGPGGKGLMVATRDLTIGEVIIEERPLVMAPRIATAGDLEAIVDMLPEENRKVWDNLPNCKGPDVPLNQAILRSNAVSKSLSKMDKMPYGGVFNQLSRMEHSCCPNTYVRRFDDSVVDQVIANRFIPKGASITTENVDVLRPRSQRQSDLERMWSFECHCEVCDFKNIGELKASDHRRAFLSKKVTLGTLIEWCEKADSLGQSNVNQLLKEIKYAEVERLGFYPNIAFSKICLFFVYFGIGLLDKSIELAESVLPTIKLFDFVVPEPIITQMENTVNGVRLTSKDPKEEPPRKSSKKLDISDIRRMVSDPNGKMIFLQPEGPMEPWMEDVMSGNFDPDIPVAEVPLEQMVGYMLDSKGPDGRKEFERFRKRMDEDPAFEQYNTEMVRRMGILPEEYFKSHGKKVHLGMPTPE